MDSETDTTTGSFQSQLPSSRERFVSEVVARSLEFGERAPEDFLRRFPPRVMMEGLASEPTLRARILAAATGTKLKIGVRKSVASTSEDLEIALREGEAEAKDVLSAFLPDDRVRFLPLSDLWSFVAEDRFWSRSPKDGASYERARALIAYVLDRALAHGLLTHEELVTPITAKAIPSTVSADDLWGIVHTALASNGKFSHRNFLEAMPVESLTQHVALSDLWERIIAPQVAAKEGLSPGAKPPTGESIPPPAEAKAPSIPPPAEAKAPSIPPPAEARAPSSPPPAGARARSVRPRPPAVRPSPSVRPPPSSPTGSRPTASKRGAPAAPSPAKASAALPVSDAELVPDNGHDEAVNVVGADELLDAVDDEDEELDDAATFVMDSPLTSDGGDPAVRAVLEQLHAAGMKLPNAAELQLEDLLVTALIELDYKAYARQRKALESAPASFLSATLCTRLAKKNPQVADAIAGILGVSRRPSTPR